MDHIIVSFGTYAPKGAYALRSSQMKYEKEPSETGEDIVHLRGVRLASTEKTPVAQKIWGVSVPKNVTDYYIDRLIERWNRKGFEKNNASIENTIPGLEKLLDFFENMGDEFEFRVTDIG
jgi:hypothetical protein